MPGNSDVTIAQSVAITDPGEKDRAEQTWADRIVVQFGNLTAWLFPLLIIAICTQVVIRKMGNNQAWLDDAQWWLYGFAMTVGFAYAITTQSHVRVDILHQNFAPRKKARVEVVGLGWLLLPFLLVMTDILFHYGWASVVAGEGSDSANGLHRLYLLKISLPVLFVLAVVATISMAIRHLSKFTTPLLWRMILAMLPGVWFVCERLVFYVLWWGYRLAQPDLNPRRIAREDIFAYTIWLGLALMTLIFIISFVRTRGTNREA